MDKQLLEYFTGELPDIEKSALFHRIENDSQLKADFILLQNLGAVSGPIAVFRG